MPFINSKVTVKMSEEKKEAVKAKLGELGMEREQSLIGVKRPNFL